MSAKLADILMPSPMITIEVTLIRTMRVRLYGCQPSNFASGVLLMATAMAQSVAAALGT